MNEDEYTPIELFVEVAKEHPEIFEKYREEFNKPLSPFIKSLFYLKKPKKKK